MNGDEYSLQMRADSVLVAIFIAYSSGESGEAAIIPRTSLKGTECKDKHHKHVVTGDLNIVKGNNLRNIMHKVADDSDLEPLESVILDLEDDCEDIQDKIDSPLKIFRLTTVTYGTKSEPYLATRSLKQLAIDDGDNYPLAAEVIMSDVYMDDLLTGADDLESGRKLQVQLVSMLKGAGMELHKWSASNPLLLPDSMCQVKDLSYSSSTETMTLGLLWKPHPDSFAFKISPMASNGDNPHSHKEISNFYNRKNIRSAWTNLTNALESINCLDIPRYCLQDKSIRTELHGFSDSSEKAYGAALYLRCINTSGEISVRLLCSKSKVAPP
ncbi:uncharacterized protein TNCV_2309911 [Trichonephila clavipes]|nr:uncharacterized protein TNCV_2309911 [Trichonephila clavipes]